MGEAVEKVGVIVAGKEIRLWSTGQTWKLFDLGALSVERYGFPYVMFHRGDLHAMAENRTMIYRGELLRKLELPEYLAQRDRQARARLPADLVP